MKVKLTPHEGLIIWDGIYYFPLSNYPNIAPWELNKLLAFVNYEKRHNRSTEFVCEDEAILQVINQALAFPETAQDTPLPDKMTQCTHCNQNGCLTHFVCHTATIGSAKAIFSSGKLLSAVKAHGKTEAELVAAAVQAGAAYEPQDPADYYRYVMFSWGNCPAGDNLVMQREMRRKLGRLPTAHDLEHALEPGVRFYFRHKDILRHPGYEYDGYHPAKVKDELLLHDYLYACIIPAQNKSELVAHIPAGLMGKVHFIPQDGLGLLGWTEKVYEFVSSLGLSD